MTTNSETVLIAETGLGKYQVEARMGDAALLIDPQDSSHLAATLSRVLESPALQGDLRSRGLARANQLSVS